jgi:VanZ family protein
MYRLLKSHRYTVLSLLVLMIIFSFSLQAGVESDLQSGFVVKWVIAVFELLNLPTTGYPLAFYVRKVAHLSEYFVFGLTWLLSVQELKNPKFLFLGFLIPMVDEGIQAFVPLRSPSIMDMGIDALGLSLGILLMHVLMRLKSKQL